MRMNIVMKDIWVIRKKEQIHDSAKKKENYIEFPDGEWALYEDLIMYNGNEKWIRTKDGSIEGFRRANKSESNQCKLQSTDSLR